MRNFHFYKIITCTAGHQLLETYELIRLINTQGWREVVIPPLFLLRVNNTFQKQWKFNNCSNLFMVGFWLVSWLGFLGGLLFCFVFNFQCPVKSSICWIKDKQLRLWKQTASTDSLGLEITGNCVYLLPISHYSWCLNYLLGVQD